MILPAFIRSLFTPPVNLDAGRLSLTHAAQETADESVPVTRETMARLIQSQQVIMATALRYQRAFWLMCGVAGVLAVLLLWRAW